MGGAFAPPAVGLARSSTAMLAVPDGVINVVTQERITIMDEEGVQAYTNAQEEAHSEPARLFCNFDQHCVHRDPAYIWPFLVTVTNEQLRCQF